MKIRWHIITWLFLLSTGLANSQEIVTGLSYNRQMNAASSYNLLKNSKGTDTINLPFIDDFSYESPYPSQSLWDDKMTFINNTFSSNQITQGVATFDCLDEYGKLYEEASSGAFSADSLTSVYIDLSYAPEDSVYLSFLYEAGGIADLPETNDSLTLHFWSPSEKKWYNVWHAEGEATSGFKQVMIPVTASRFLDKGFRFRFINYASLSGIGSEPSKAGNADQWNIDYVKLDKNRTVNDIFYRDVAMTLPQRSLIKGYEAIPWNQFKKAYLTVMSDTVSMFFRNNDTLSPYLNVYWEINIFDVYKNELVHRDTVGNTNVPPLSVFSQDTTLIYNFYDDEASVSQDSALFRVTTLIDPPDPGDPSGNDTLHFYQYFNDYYAIDDGTAEAGYGINGQGSRTAMAALKFRAFLPDSVAAVRLCFNDAVNNANQRGFDIKVWADNNGVPGALLGTTEGPVAAPGIDNNGFVTYYFEHPIRVSGYFWIGWQQLSETFLNAGLDLNTPHENRQYFCLNGIWQPSQAPGIIMMRAVMSCNGSTTSTGYETLFNDLFRLYPNPTSGEMTLEASDLAPDDYRISIYNLTGTCILSLPRTENPDVSQLPAGYYIMAIKTVKGVPLSLIRFIKTN